MPARPVKSASAASARASTAERGHAGVTIEYAARKCPRGSVPPGVPESRSQPGGAHRPASRARSPMTDGRYVVDDPHLAPLGPLVVDRFALPGTNEIVSIVRPDDIDRPLDGAAADPEQNLPYGAELWPSGVALAASIARAPDLVRNARCLELGCGLGVTAV